MGKIQFLAYKGRIYRLNEKIRKSGFREGVIMAQEEFKAMMDELTAEEIKRLGVGSEEFQERHREIMDLIEDAERYQKEGSEWRDRL